MLNNWSCFKCKFIVQTVCIDHFNCVYLIHLHHLFIWLAIVLSCLRLVDKILWMHYCGWWCRFIQNTLNFACVIPQTEFLGPAKMMNKRILKLCDNLKNWCVSFSPSLSLLFGPSIILSSILLLFSFGSRPWRNDQLWYNSSSLNLSLYIVLYDSI